jgi:hypothetical protein
MQKLELGCYLKFRIEKANTTFEVIKAIVNDVKSGEELINPRWRTAHCFQSKYSNS